MSARPSLMATGLAPHSAARRSASAAPFGSSGRCSDTGGAMVACAVIKICLVGLPKSGKASLFNLLTGSSVATSSFGASRGEMHAGVARVPDERVDRLTALFKPKKTTLASFEVVDLAG